MIHVKPLFRRWPRQLKTGACSAGATAGVNKRFADIWTRAGANVKGT